MLPSSFVRSDGEATRVRQHTTGALTGPIRAAAPHRDRRVSWGVSGRPEALPRGKTPTDDARGPHPPGDAGSSPDPSSAVGRATGDGRAAAVGRSQLPGYPRCVGDTVPAHGPSDHRCLVVRRTLHVPAGWVVCAPPRGWILLKAAGEMLVGDRGESPSAAKRLAELKSSLCLRPCPSRTCHHIPGRMATRPAPS